MITVARLRERNISNGMALRSYTSSFGARYVAGKDGKPSNLRIVTKSEEVQELSALPQMQLMQFETLEDAERFINEEMQSRVRSGSLPVQAKIENAPPKPAPTVPVIAPPVINEPKKVEVKEAAPEQKPEQKPEPKPRRRIGRSGRKSKA